MKENKNYITLTDANFQREVLESTCPILVQIGADWCGPCHIMAPMMDELSAEFKGQIRIGKLDIDENEQVAKEYGIHDLPILLFFKNGQIVDHIIGTVPKSVIADKLNAILKKSSASDSEFQVKKDAKSTRNSKV